MKLGTKIIIGTVAALSLSIAVIAVILNFIPLKKEQSASDIYDKCIYNVVEVKATAENVGESYGTGEIISGDGTIVTNAHVVTYSKLNVVNKFENYFIRFAFEDEYRSVRLVKYDDRLDLAVLKLDDISDISLTPIKTGDSDRIKAGERVYAVGNASNYGIGIFSGMVSVPLVNIELNGLIRSVIQCDLTIAAGNSGGALVNTKGELIGITTFRTKDNSGNVVYGIGYCIPINTVLGFTNE